MNILIDLGSHLMSEANYRLLVKNGHDDGVVSGWSWASGYRFKNQIRWREKP